MARRNPVESGQVDVYYHMAREATCSYIKLGRGARCLSGGVSATFLSSPMPISLLCLLPYWKPPRDDYVETPTPCRTETYLHVKDLVIPSLKWRGIAASQAGPGPSATV